MISIELISLSPKKPNTEKKTVAELATLGIALHEGNIAEMGTGEADRQFKLWVRFGIGILW